MNSVSSVHTIVCFLLFFLYLFPIALADSPHVSTLSPSITGIPSLVRVDSKKPRTNEPYWSTDGKDRTVRLAIYSTYKKKLDPKAKPTLWQRFKLQMGTITSHIEVHVGNTAYSLFAHENIQEIHTRHTEWSHRVFGQQLLDRISYCDTQHTDDEIVDYMEHHFRGSFHMLELNCRFFAQSLIHYLCPKVKPERIIPLRYRFVNASGANLNRGFNKLHHSTFGKQLARIPQWKQLTDWYLNKVLKRHDQHYQDWKWSAVPRHHMIKS